MRRRWTIVLLGLLAAGAACDSPTNPAQPVTLAFDLGAETHGWTAGFVDYPVGREDRHELLAAHRALPPPLDTTRSGFLLSGRNQSDDLFMFLKRPVTDLEPDTRYRVRYRARFGTNAPAGCIGVGGAPGESVVVKAGAATTEPIAVVREGFYRLSVDKGNQFETGANSLLLGNIANSSTDCSGAPYEIKELDSGPDSLPVTTDAHGELWLFLGTESGHEHTTALYYTFIGVELEPVD